ncbi:hypothetical protein AaE_013790 [Aphanomyces astaci]|uniref:MULE transposase domain-containing protein n=1 Tax=Aphanomyces astaci TaxID=112090 RepID=A0A6A4Z9M1_APHAT|nr:hypothetical protein AaE_013790 [Aphanomyces astaci]
MSSTDPRQLTGKYIVGQIQRLCGETISTSSASRAKRALVKHYYGSVDMAFEKVASYFDLLKSRNPGTFTSVETRNGSFYRSVLVPGFCVNAFQHCQNLVALDGAHLKDLMNSNGVLLLATVKDPNNHLVVLGIAMVPVDNVLRQRLLDQRFKLIYSDTSFQSHPKIFKLMECETKSEVEFFEYLHVNTVHPCCAVLQLVTSGPNAVLRQAL